MKVEIFEECEKCEECEDFHEGRKEGPAGRLARLLEQSFEGLEAEIELEGMDRAVVAAAADEILMQRYRESYVRWEGEDVLGRYGRLI